MWEQKAAKQKLKQDAVPTIFGYYLKKKVMENKNVTQVIKNSKISNHTES